MRIIRRCGASRFACEGEACLDDGRQCDGDLGAARGTREFADTRYHVWKALHGTPAAQSAMH